MHKVDFSSSFGKLSFSAKCWSIYLSFSLCKGPLIATLTWSGTKVPATKSVSLNISNYSPSNSILLPPNSGKRTPSPSATHMGTLTPASPLAPDTAATNLNLFHFNIFTALALLFILYIKILFIHMVTIFAGLLDPFLKSAESNIEPPGSLFDNNSSRYDNDLQ